MIRREQIGDATLYLGDCRDVLPTLSGVDAVVTDPPYGVDKAKWDTVFPVRDTWCQITNVMALGGNLVVIPGEASVPGKIEILSSLLDYQWVITWYKPNAMQFGKAGFSKHNLIWWFSKGPPLVRPNMIDVIVVPMGLGADACSAHPSPKPERLCRILVDNFSAHTSMVLDPFMGSGTTGVACARLGRSFIGCEIESIYFDIACRRIEQAQRQRDLFHLLPSATAQTDKRIGDLFQDPAS